MKLTPKQVALVYPFLPGFVSRVLRFTGRRNTVHLQETALVLEGELIRFHYLGLERFFARALAEWTTITVPYSRLVRVKYKSRRWLRASVVFFAILILALAGIGLVNDRGSDTSLAFLLFAITTLIVVLLTWLVFRVVRPGFAVKFRAKDGTKTKFLFGVRKKSVRKEFGARLNEYRAAADVFIVKAREDRS